MNIKIRSSLELIFAAMIWGYGFLATLWVLQCFDVVSSMLIRFGLSFAIGSLIFVNKKYRPQFNKKNIIASMGPGFFLGLTLAFQTWGLEFTSVTNSGFITTLYVVMVPIIEIIIFRRMPSPLHAVWVAIALIGTALMTNLQLNGVNKGDVFTLICALCGAIQIVWVGRVADSIKSPFVFNVFQSFWSAIAILVFWPVYGAINIKPITPLAIWGFTVLVVGSTLIAFALQIKAQKVISSSVASLIFLLESPFALLFAIIILNDKVSLNQGFGGLLIMLSSAAAIATAQKRKPKIGHT